MISLFWLPISLQFSWQISFKSRLGLAADKIMPRAIVITPHLRRRPSHHSPNVSQFRCCKLVATKAVCLESYQHLLMEQRLKLYHPTERGDVTRDLRRLGFNNVMEPDLHALFSLSLFELSQKLVYKTSITRASPVTELCTENIFSYSRLHLLTCSR